MLGPRSTLAGAVVGLVLTAAQPSPPPGTFDVAGTYATVAAQAPCKIDPRDLYGIQQVESPSAVVDATGLVTFPDGQLVRGDGGDSYGAFQFNVPAGTWPIYGNGGNPDLLPDAAAATGRMLCADGYATNRHAAIAAHNGSGPAAQAYADKVIAIADGTDPNLIAGKVNITSAQGSAPTPGDKYHGSAGRLADRLVGKAIESWEAIEGKLDDGKHTTSLAIAKKVGSAIDGLAGDGPVASPAGTPAPAAPSAGKPVDGVLCPVVDGLEVGDGWGADRTGHSHQGIDLFGTAGSPVVSPWEGDVTSVENDETDGGLGGLAVVIRATSGPQAGAEVYLAHNDRNTVAMGQHVRQGQQVAVVGNSGNARGGATHVHTQYYPPGIGTPAPAEPTIGKACGGDPIPKL